MLTEKTEQESLDEAIKEWLAKGNKITICEPGARTEDIVVGQWGKRKKAKKVEKKKKE